MTVFIYEITDAYGNKSAASCESGFDQIMLSGFTWPYKEPTMFESDARHAIPWANENNFALSIHKIDLDTERRAIRKWEVTEHGGS